jgi:hypothetical protein
MTNNLDAGDVAYRPGDTVTLDAGSNTVNKGDAVTFDASADLAQCSANDDNLVGVALEGAEGDGQTSVHVVGLVVAVNADGDINAGDTLIPSGSTNGHFIAHTGGMYITNDDSGANDIAANHPIAMEDATDGDVMLAIFR